MEKLKKKFSFLRERRIYERLDVYPYVIIQSLLMIIYTNKSINSLVRGILFGFVCLCQGLTFFCKFWSENLMAKICYKQVDSIEKATYIKADIISEKFKMNNRTQICKLEKENNIIKMELEKILHVYNPEKKEFFRPKLEILKKNTVGELLSINPIKFEDVPKLRSKFGENRMKIPIPSFFSLYKEHIVAPFFVFQLFCILLWVFDDYGLHSFISLVMLCVFELTVVGQRIFNLTTLRNMRVPPHYLFVYRNNVWKKILSSELLPGDIVSIIDGASVMSIKEEDEEAKGNIILRILKYFRLMKKKAEQSRARMNKNKDKDKEKEEEKKKKEKEASPLTSDMLLLSGSIIVNESMLTGESVPQIKDSVTKLDPQMKNLLLDTKLRHKNSMIFAGTKVVKTERNEEHEPLPPNVATPPPDGGAICLVIKTGFSTSQGKLLRTVLYSGERNKGGDTKEAFIFIGVLLIIALISSYHVLKKGLEREGTLTYKLFLRCIIIITSVVPAELPIELSLTINSSLFFLQSKRIVCIEPFRIPFAGKIDICCFDKTGTLTKDEFIMKGVVKTNSNVPENALDSKDETISILLGCNSLLNISGKPVGDPIEVAMFKEVKGKFDHTETYCEKNIRVSPIRKYQFESSLKRMTVLARVYNQSTKIYYNRVLCKGAPETIKTLLKEVPDKYDETFRKWAKEGYRILALAYLDNENFDYNTKREDLEKDLIFCGFAIVETPLKDSVSKYITELIKAKYGVCIITGDHLLTTSKVSKDLKLGPDKFGLLKIENGIIKWNDLDNNFIKETKTVDEIKELAKNYTLGLTGDEYKHIDEVQNMPNKHEMTQYIKLFCRVSPTQKDDIIKDLIKSGKNPSMCGDGSNDVGALKRATIGVAVLNIEETETQKKEPFNFLSFDEDTTIKSGDVTAAAPFTSKSGSIKCIKNIFIQGRCTLVTNFQMYKILALNCLMTAYSESVLALKGIRFSDYQSTIMGFIVSIFFLMLSRAVPLNKVNSNHPPMTIFTVASIISIIGQAVVDIGSMVLILYMTEQIDPMSINQEKSLDEKFSPTLINSIMFLFQLLNQTITFVVNYQGEPFMQNLSNNGAMKKLIIGILIFSGIYIFDLFPQLNENLEIIPLPESDFYRYSLIVIMTTNFIICYLLEKWKNLFGYYEPYPAYKPKDKNKKKK